MLRGRGTKSSYARIAIAGTMVTSEVDFVGELEELIPCKRDECRSCSWRLGEIMARRLHRAATTSGQFCAFVYL